MREREIPVDHAEAFTRFYTGAHAPVLAAVRVTLGDEQLARDAVDEAFVRAAERWGTVHELTNPRGWVYRVAVNWATSWRRKWSRRPTRPVEELDRPHRDPLPDLDLIDALAVLPLEQRQMLVLRHALGCSVRETASALGVAEGTVKSGVHRARERLRADGAWQDPDPRDARPDVATLQRDDDEVFDGRA